MKKTLDLYGETWDIEYLYAPNFGSWASSFRLYDNDEIYTYGINYGRHVRRLAEYSIPGTDQKHWLVHIPGQYHWSGICSQVYEPSELAIWRTGIRDDGREIVFPLISFKAGSKRKKLETALRRLLQDIADGRLEYEFQQYLSEAPTFVINPVKEETQNDT